MKIGLVRIQAYLADRRAQFEQEGKLVALTDCIYEEEVHLDSIQIDELESAILKLDDSKTEVQDHLLEVSLGDEGEHKFTFVSQLLEPEF